jgi:hypothetical protein
LALRSSRGHCSRGCRSRRWHLLSGCRRAGDCRRKGGRRRGQLGQGPGRRRDEGGTGETEIPWLTYGVDPWRICVRRFHPLMIIIARDGDLGCQHLGCGRLFGPPARAEQDGGENHGAHGQSGRPCDESSDKDAVTQPVAGLRWLLRCDLPGDLPGEVVWRWSVSTVRVGQRVGPSLPARPRRKLRSPAPSVNVFQQCFRSTVVARAAGPIRHAPEGPDPLQIP